MACSEPAGDPEGRAAAFPSSRNLPELTGLPWSRPVSRFATRYRRSRGAAGLALDLLWVCLVSPAALGLLGAFSPRTSLGPLLDGLVARYASWSRVFWGEIVPSTFDIWISVPHGYLSLIALMLLPIAVNAAFYLSSRIDYDSNSLSWPIASSLCILLFAFSFGVMADMWIGSFGLALYVLAFLILLVLIVLLAAAATGFSLSVARWRNLHISTESEINLVIVALVAFMAAVLVGTLSFGGGQSRLDMERMALFGVALLGVYLSFKLKLKAPVYVMAAALGGLTTGMTVDFVIPALEDLANAASRLGAAGQ